MSIESIHPPSSLVLGKPGFSPSGLNLKYLLRLFFLTLSVQWTLQRSVSIKLPTLYEKLCKRFGNSPSITALLPVARRRIVLYPHCKLIASSHKIKLWEESAPVLATTTTTHKLANNTDTKRFQHDFPLILSITQIPLNNHNPKRNFKTKRGWRNIMQGGNIRLISWFKQYIVSCWDETPGSSKGSARRE